MTLAEALENYVVAGNLEHKARDLYKLGQTRVGRAVRFRLCSWL